MPRVSLFDEGPPAPCPTPFNMADYVLSAGRGTPEKSALEILSGVKADIWTYGALEDAVMATAGALQARGLVAGAQILLRMGNEVNFPIVFLAAIAAGFVPVPTSSQLTVREVALLIKKLNPALICACVGLDLPSGLSCQVLTGDEITAMRHHSRGLINTGDPDRLAYIITTSGTSGTPQLVEHAHRAVWARRMMWDGWYGLTADDRLFHAGAFNWTYTLGTGLCDPWAVGATALIAAPGVGTDEIAGLLRNHKASIFAAAPGIYRQILNSGDSLDLPHLRHALSAGEKLPEAIRETWQSRSNQPIYEALGMSEVSTFISSSPTTPPQKGAIGRPQAGRRVAVLDEDSHSPVAVNTPGVLAVSWRDPGLMLGYRGENTVSQNRFSGEWFLTGDVVEMDKDGYITYLGRNDDMMNAGGYRVSPIEVETVLNAHDHIHESAAVSVEIKPDTFVIAAFYQSDLDLSDKELSVYCASRLARYKCPRLFWQMDTLPKGANGKLRRGELRKVVKDRT